MSQKFVDSRKIPSNKGISIIKAIEIFHGERMGKEICSSSITNGGEISSESSVGSSTTRKEFVTKMKVVNKRHAQKMILT